MAQTVKNLPAMQETQARSLDWEDPLEKGMAAAAAAKSLQSCLTLCDPIDGSPPGSAVPGILQARTLEWVSISFSNAGKWKVKVKLKALSHVWLLATHGLQPTRLLCPWDFPGKSTGVGCHCLLQGASYPLHYSCLGNPMDTGAWWANMGLQRVIYSWEINMIY